MSTRTALLQLGGTMIGGIIGLAIGIIFWITSSLWAVLIACACIFVGSLAGAWLGFRLDVKNGTTP